MASMRACPKWRAPVTLGGGITMMNFFLLGSFRTLSALAWKNCSFSHQEYQAASTYLGWYCIVIGFDISFFIPAGVVSGSHCSSAFTSSAA
jgi:hypothetical protein